MMRTLSKKSARAGHRAVSLNRDCVLVLFTAISIKIDENYCLHENEIFASKEPPVEREVKKYWERSRNLSREVEDEWERSDGGR